jgi:hypothetical protein
MVAERSTGQPQTTGWNASSHVPRFSAVYGPSCDFVLTLA